MPDTAPAAPALTDDQRDALDSKLQRLQAAIAEIEKARRPFDRAIDVLQEQIDCALEEAGIDGEPLGHCETCGFLLLPGDRGHHIAEPNLYFCEEHAPTWNDMLDQYQEIGPEDLVDLEPEEFEQGKASAQARVDAGDGDVKYVWTLG